ncbi:MAG: hypothetical protein D6690_07325 [Nitrospirae bacterium]|nr:MAG: hypothetical protein D6690_07325 [Nitrospirota bacterium]
MITMNKTKNIKRRRSPLAAPQEDNRSSARRSRRKRSVPPQRVAPTAFIPSMLTQCPKCHGLPSIIPQDSSQPLEIRCINCGWQPQWGTKIIVETEEARTMRRLTVQSSTQGLSSTRRIMKQAG